jgi:exopolyphosphatase/guanosine-5'-triphosphate,3'-diphosphate pyrophosphatase
MRKAVIDIGTNSVKYLLAEIEEKRKPLVLKDVLVITKLGEKLRKEGIIIPSAATRTLDSIKRFVLDARKDGAKDIRLVGTMALRTASNADEFVEKVRAATGFEIDILSGETEAILSFSGAVTGFDLSCVKKFCTIDTGGGSTELVFAENGEIICKTSLKTGALLLTEKYFSRDKVSKEDLKNTDQELDIIFGSTKPPFATQLAIGIGGNVTSMASVFKRMARYDSKEIHGTEIPYEEIERQIQEYSSKNLQERRHIRGLDPERAGIILAGACIISRAMKFCGCRKLVVSTRGLRHGVLHSCL